METEKNRKDFANGKIYKIEPICDHEVEEIYYGSTTQLLSKRMGDHRTKYKAWKENKYNKIMVYNIFDKYGVENCKIYLVEDYPCERREQLERREGEIIKANRCANKIVVGRTKKEYRKDNKDMIYERNKTYNEKNKTKIAENKKHYYEENKDEFSEKSKKYRENNKDIIKQKKSKKCKCECGQTYTQNHKARHYKTVKHQKYETMKTQLQEINTVQTEMQKIFKKHQSFATLLKATE
jgi:hypothetical protein